MTAVDLPTLAAVDLRRALLDRQLLSARAAGDVPGVLSRVASLQSQYAPTMYVGLWSRLAGFRRDDLTTALGDRQVVQGTMMRSTIHLTAAADYWPLNLAIRESRREWYLRSHAVEDTDVRAAATRVRAAFDGADVLSRRDLDAVAGPVSAAVGLFVDLVRVPPSGTWERRRADLFGLAERWVGPPPDITTADAWAHAVRHYLTGFGPASANEIASWAGVKVGAVTPVVRSMALDRYRAADGKVLVDLPGLAIPPAAMPLPVRFIGNWEALLLVHARRAEVLAEADRPRIFATKTPHSFSVFLVDGVVTGTWRHDDGRIVVDPWRPLTATERGAVDDEAARLATFHT